MMSPSQQASLSFNSIINAAEYHTEIKSDAVHFCFRKDSQCTM